MLLTNTQCATLPVKEKVVPMVTTIMNTLGYFGIHNDATDDEGWVILHVPHDDWEFFQLAILELEKRMQKILPKRLT